MPIINQVVAGSGGGSGPASYRVFQLDNGKLTNSTSTPWVPLPAGTTDLDGYILYAAYKNAPSNVLSGSVDLSSLTQITGNSALYYCFGSCTGITSVNLSSLKTVTAGSALYQCFQGCTGLINVDLSSLEEISGANSNQMRFCFAGTGLPYMYFQSLKTITTATALAMCFQNCTLLQTVWFYALNTNSFGSRTNQFNNMLVGCTNVTVHFPIVVQSVIGSWSDVSGGFSGTNTTVLFDIVTTLTGADGNTYTRSEKNSTSTATAWTYNDTLYYTSGVSNHTAGVNEPSVADTIYSDAACTTAVTTISAIA